MKELIDLLNRVKGKIQLNSDMTWVPGYEKPEDLLSKIEEYIELAQQKNSQVMEELNVEFAPTSSLQEHSMSNEWSDEYLKMAEEFDQIFTKMMKK